MWAVGNILSRAHNYFQDFWKRFSILIKAQQLQFNRKRKLKQKKEKEAHLGLTWLGPAYWLGQSPPTSRQEAGARARRAPATRRPPPASADVGTRPETPRDPLVPLSSSLTLPLVSLILSRDGRARSSLPYAVVVTRATPSLL